METMKFGVMMQICEVRETGKDTILLLRFKTLRKMAKPFAEIRYADVPTTKALLNDAERWVVDLMRQAKLTRLSTAG